MKLGSRFLTLLSRVLIIFDTYYKYNFFIACRQHASFVFICLAGYLAACCSSRQFWPVVDSRRCSLQTLF